MTNLEKYLYQLRRIEEHREQKAEKEIRKIYQDVLKGLRQYIGEIYATYSEDDKLDFSSLAKAGMDARFLEEVEQRINGISPDISRQIRETVELTYEACFDGMTNAVIEAAGDRAKLKKALSAIKPVTPDVIKAAVQNPIAGLTLNDTLEKHRKDIIYDIKKNIGVGLSNGDRYTTMADRIKESVEGDYNKAIRIVRTETHRVRESGLHDSAENINETLKGGSSGMVMAKTWKTMKDEYVRPSSYYKTKKGKKKSRRKGKYNHVKMDGVTIPVDDFFILPSGAKTKAPGQSGVAGEDINCRCVLSYDLVEADKLTDQKGSTKKADKPKEEPKQEQQEQKTDVKMGNLESQIPKEHIEAMKQQLEAAPELSRKLWNRYADSIAVADSNHRGGAFFRRGGIHVNMDTVTKDRYTYINGQKTLFKKAYGTMYHEFGHNIDYEARTTQGGSSWQFFSELYKSKNYTKESGTGYTLGDMIKEEANDHVKNTWNRLKDEAVKNGGKKSDVRKYLAYNDIAKELKSIDLLASADVMDMFEGATNAAVSTYCGHGKNYWKNCDVGIEAFAEMYDASVNNPESLNTIRRYFPKSYEIFEEMLEELTKGDF